MLQALNSLVWGTTVPRYLTSQKRVLTPVYTNVGTITGGQASYTWASGSNQGLAVEWQPSTPFTLPGNGESIVNGLQVDVTRYESTTQNLYVLTYPFFTGGGAATKVGSQLTTTSVVESFGGSSDLWTASSLDTTTVNAPDFKFAVNLDPMDGSGNFQVTSGAVTGYITQVAVTVYYLSSTAPPFGSRMMFGNGCFGF